MAKVKRAKIKHLAPHFSKDMTDDQLIAFWLITFGDRAVSTFEMNSARARDKDVLPIADELAARDLVDISKDKFFGTHIFSLKRALEHADS